VVIASSSSAVGQVQPSMTSLVCRAATANVHLPPVEAERPD
jgi:hypothetical protein